MNEIKAIINSLGEDDSDEIYHLYTKNGNWWKISENTKDELVEDWLRRLLRCEYKGKDLEFISLIGRNGQTLEKTYDQSFLDDEYFTLHPLSLSEKTYIAHGFNSFVVKKKK